MCRFPSQVRVTFEALQALALNIGVPRDMAIAPAIALRANLRLFAHVLENVAKGIGG